MQALSTTCSMPRRTATCIGRPAPTGIAMGEGLVVEE